MRIGKDGRDKNRKTKKKKQPTLVCFYGDEGGAVMAISIGAFFCIVRSTDSVSRARDLGCICSF